MSTSPQHRDSYGGPDIPLVASGNPPGLSVAVVKDGRLAYERAFGAAEGPRVLLPEAVQQMTHEGRVGGRGLGWAVHQENDDKPLICQNMRATVAP